MPKIFIKNMVCERCKMAVRQVFDEAGADVMSVELGEVELKEELRKDTSLMIESKLKDYGFEVIDSKKARLIENIKLTIIDFVRKQAAEESLKLSVILSNKLHYEYTYLSNLFTEVEGKTIEQFHILQRIERAKELLVYDELNLNEIAYQLGYKSPAHLSTQFKKITGLTPTHFRHIRANKRISLGNL